MLNVGKREIEFEGVVYKNKMELFDAYGVNYNTAINKMSKLDYSIEECIYGRKLKRFYLDGIEFLNMKEVSDYTGFTTKSLYKYKEKGLQLQVHVNNIRKKKGLTK